MKNIPYGHQWISADDIKALNRALNSDYITQGPEIARFENALCDYTGAKFCVVVSNGTAALHLACLAAGIKPNTEVVTSPLTFVASANCVLYCGARPEFCDVLFDTANLDTDKICLKVTKRTKMLIPVHYAGHPCDMEQIKKIARKHNLFILEDAAHALGAKYKNSKIGSCEYSDMTIFSFHPVKHITTGEGGAILTNQKGLYKKLAALRNHGIIKNSYLNSKYGDWYYQMRLLGFNYRMTDFQAALGISQLKRLDSFVRRRREIAGIYNQAFQDSDFFDLPVEKSYAYSSYHLYPVRLKKPFIKKKRELFAALRGSGLGVQVHYIPVYLQPYYRKLGFLKGICPAAEGFYASEISLPLYALMSSADIKYVIKKVRDVFNE